MIVTKDRSHVILSGVTWLTGVRYSFNRRFASAEWDAKNQQWKFPLTTRNCRTLRRILGRDLEVDPELADWYRNVEASSPRLGSV